MMSRLIRFCALAAAAFLMPSAWAQDPPPLTSSPSMGRNTMRTVSGQVVLRGAAVTNIRITVTSSTRSFQRTVYADGAGSFSINVPIGQYSFEIESEGYQTQREDVDVPPGSGIFPVQFMLSPMPVQATTFSKDATVSVVSLNIPQPARNEYEAGRKEAERKHGKEAREHFEKALGLHAAFPHAHYELARLDRNEGQNAQAIEHLRQSVAIDPSFAEGFLLLSHLLNEAGNNQEALDTAARALALRPNEWQGYFQHGMAALALDLVDVAEQDSNRIETLEGQKAPDIHLLRAGVFLKLRRTPEAREQLTLFLKRAPGHRHAGLVRQTLQALNVPPSGSPPPK